MKEYRRKEVVLAWKWTGDKSIIDNINKTLESYNGKFKVGVSTDENILYASHKRDDESCSLTSTDFVRLGEYIVFDVNNEDRPFGRYSEEWLNKTYEGLG
jgi:hypothetical protein